MTYRTVAGAFLAVSCSLASAHHEHADEYQLTAKTAEPVVMKRVLNHASYLVSTGETSQLLLIRSSAQNVDRLKRIIRDLGADLLEVSPVPKRAPAKSI